MKRHLAVGLLVITLLAGCAPLIVGGVMGGGAMVATDRRSAGMQLEDQTLQNRVGNELSNKLNANPTHINTNTFDRKVLLTGEVPTAQARQEAEKIAASTLNVRMVVNELVVAPPSDFAARSNDTLITSGVRAAFINTKEIVTNSVDIITERNVVYLMGIVTQQEGEVAAYVAARSSGVTKVVKVFDYVTAEELKRMLRQDQAPAPVVSPTK